MGRVARTLSLWGISFLVLSVSHVWWDVVVNPMHPPELPFAHLNIGYHEILDFFGVVAHALFLRHLLALLRSKRQHQLAPGELPHPTRRCGMSVFLMEVGIAVMCIGVGVHTATNSLHSIVNPGNEKSRVIDAPLNKAIYVWDEVLGHHIWYAGLLLCWGVVATRPTPKRERYKQDCLSCSDLFPVVTVGAFHGVWMFFAAVEGQAVGLFVGFVALVVSTWAWKRLPLTSLYAAGSIRVYFIAAFTVFALTMCGYGAKYGWEFPEFRVLGLGPFNRWPGHFLRWLQSIVP